MLDVLPLDLRGGRGLLAGGATRKKDDRVLADWCAGHTVRDGGYPNSLLPGSLPKERCAI